MLAPPNCSFTFKAKCFWIAYSFDKGLSWLVWHTAFILDAVIRPARYLNHKLELLWSRVAFSIESADSAVIPYNRNIWRREILANGLNFPIGENLNWRNGMVGSRDFMDATIDTHERAHERDTPSN